MVSVVSLGLFASLLHCDVCGIAVNSNLKSAGLEPQGADGDDAPANYLPDGIKVQEWLKIHTPHDDEYASQEWRMNDARSAVKVCKTHYWACLSEKLFLNWIVPYTHFDERPTQWRQKLGNVLQPLVASHDFKTAKQAADLILKEVWTSFGDPPIQFKANSTPEVLTPDDVLEKRYGSCTGMSIFLANSFRSVGIPARVVGVAEWNIPTKGNHNWVEVWFDGKWNFIDSAPGETEWNKAWFVKQAALGLDGTTSGVYAPVWDVHLADGEYTITWRESGPFKRPAIQITQRYRDACNQDGKCKKELAAEIARRNDQSAEAGAMQKSAGLLSLLLLALQLKL